MSTRSIVHVKSDQGKIIGSFWRKRDGYPTGMGEELQDLGATPEVFSDAKRLAEAIGAVPINRGEGRLGEEYTYVVSTNQGCPTLEVFSDHTHQVLYSGALAAFNGQKAESQE